MKAPELQFEFKGSPVSAERVQDLLDQVRHDLETEVLPGEVAVFKEWAFTHETIMAGIQSLRDFIRSLLLSVPCTVDVWRYCPGPAPVLCWNPVESAARLGQVRLPLGPNRENELTEETPGMCHTVEALANQLARQFGEFTRREKIKISWARVLEQAGGDELLATLVGLPNVEILGLQHMKLAQELAPNETYEGECLVVRFGTGEKPELRPLLFFRCETVPTPSLTNPLQVLSNRL